MAFGVKFCRGRKDDADGHSSRAPQRRGCDRPNPPEWDPGGSHVQAHCVTSRVPHPVIIQCVISRCMDPPLQYYNDSQFFWNRLREGGRTRHVVAQRVPNATDSARCKCRSMRRPCAHWWAMCSRMTFYQVPHASHILQGLG